MRHRPLVAALPLVLLFCGAAAAQPSPGAPGGRFRQRPTPAPSTTASSPPAPTNDAPPPPPASQAPSSASPQEPSAAPQDNAAPPPRAEPRMRAPADPLAVSPEIAARIGSDAQEAPPSAAGETHRRFFPYYEERKGDSRFRILPPLYLEHTRGLPSPTAPATGAPSQEDRESLFGLLYYQRRSPKIDADVLFPLAWRVRDRENNVLVLGPFAHREAPNEHDNWIAPLMFQGLRRDGGYFHAPLLLTTSRWSPTGAFTLVGPYFRDRTAASVDLGVAPLFFHGDNGDTEGARRTYTLIPPLLFYHREREVDESNLTVVGPVVVESNLKRRIFDVAPIFFHITGRPEASGKRESHTTLFPLFHYGQSEQQSLFILPGYLRRVTKTADTMLTPLYSYAQTRNGSTSFTAIGPILPIFYRYTDRDVGSSALTLLPLFHYATRPSGRDFLTPLYGRFDEFGVSRKHWVFPTFTVSQDLNGWEADLHPLLYFGRSGQSSHAVLAPIFWDFKSLAGRTTIGFPLYWRFADTSNDSVTQVAANTLYMQKRVSGGLDWQFHLLPLFSYGENPSGYFWNVLFGLAGYERAGAVARVKALWIPIQVAGGDPARATAWAH